MARFSLLLAYLSVTWAETGIPAHLPHVVIETNQDRALNLAEWQGRIVIVNFWATWCLPCREEMVELQKAAAQRKEDLRIIAIAVDVQGWRSVTPFLREYDIRFPVAVVTPALLRSFGMERPLRLLPQTLIFDRQGRRAAHFKNAVTVKDLDGLLGPP